MVCNPKARTASKEQKDIFVQQFIERYEDKNGLPVEVDVKDASNAFNVSTSIIKEIFIDAIGKGMRNVSLNSADHSSDKPEKQSINSKGNFILPKDTIAELNKNLEEERKFKIGDKFTATLEGERIILDRVPCELPQEQDAPSDAA